MSSSFVPFEHPYLQQRNKLLSTLLGLLFIVYVIFEYDHVGDFLIYYQASTDLFLSKNIYKELYGTAHVWTYFSSPTLVFLLWPFTLLPFSIAAAIWKIMNLFIIYKIWLILESYFDIKKLSSKEYNVFVLGSFLSVSYVVYRNFALNQFTFFLLFTALVGVDLIFNKNRKVAGACIIALGVCCKLMPIVLIPYLFFRKEWKAGLLVLLFAILWFVLPSLFLGWQQEVFLMKEWLNTSNPTNDMNIFDVSTNDIHGLPSLISTLFIRGIGFDDYTLHIRRHIVDLEPSVVKLLIQAVRVFFIGFTFYFLRTMPFVREKRPRWQFWELGYIFLVTPLVFPQQRQYAFFFLFPAITYLTYYLICLNQVRLAQQRKTPSLFYLYIFAIVLFNLELIFGNFREYYWHYKTLTYSVFIILFFYARLSPKVLESKVLV